MNVVAYWSEIRNDKVFVQESTDERIVTNDIFEILNFLLESWEDEDLPSEVQLKKPIKIAYNLDEFLAPILRLIGRSNCQKLADTKRAIIGDYALFYIPDKLFSIKYKSKLEANIYGIDQFFGGILDHEPEDAIQLRELGDLLLETYRKIGMFPTKFISPVSVFTECVLNHMDIPTVQTGKYYDGDIPRDAKEAVDYATKCTGKLWISNYQVGHWEENECYSYDISSSFPSQVANLYYTKRTNCQYVKAKEIPNSADWGYIHYANCTIEKQISPIMARDNGGNLINFTGTKQDDYMTLDEYKHIKEYKLGKVDIIDGWFLSIKRYSKPFDNIANRILYQARFKGELEAVLSKGMGMGLYGKFMQKYSDGTYGEFYNPFYSAQITAKIRIQNSKFIYDNDLQDNLLAVRVDEIISDKKVELPPGNGIGKWKSSNNPGTIIISPGLVFTGDKKPHGLNYQTLLDKIKEKPNSSYYSVDLDKRLTLKEALNTNFSDIGNIKKFHSSIDLITTRMEQNRIFKKYPENGRQLLNNKYKSEAKESKNDR